MFEFNIFDAEEDVLFDGVVAVEGALSLAVVILSDDLLFVELDDEFKEEEAVTTFVGIDAKIESNVTSSSCV